MIPHSRPWLTPAEGDAVAAVAASGMVAAGPQADAFRRELEDATQHPVALAGSGTAALGAALEALGLPAGAEVILPTYVCGSVLAAVRRAGFTPVLADCGAHWAMTADTVAPRVSPRTGAIILVPLFGLPVDVAGFRSFGVPLVHDLCQGFAEALAEDGKGTGRDRGDVAVLSFHATKMLCTGTGGAVVRLVEEATPAWRGATDWLADAAPLSDLQAAMGRAQLRRWPELAERRRDLARRYLEALPEAPMRRLRAALALPGAGDAVPFRLPMSLCGAEFDAARAWFAGRGVAVRRGVDALLHWHGAAAPDRFPQAEERFADTVSLPFHPSLNEEEVAAVLEAANTFWSRCR